MQKRDFFENLKNRAPVQAKLVFLNQIGGAVWRRLQGVTGQPRASR